MGKREREFARRIAYWRGASDAVSAFTSSGDRIRAWLEAVELWAYRAHWRDPIDAAPPTVGADATLGAPSWHDASTPPARPGRYFVVVAEAEHEGMPATRRIELVDWGPYAYEAPEGFDASWLADGETHRDHAIHGHGWHAYDRTTDACTVWRPSRTDERITHWAELLPLPAASSTEVSS